MKKHVIKPGVFQLLILPARCSYTGPDSYCPWGGDCWIKIDVLWLFGHLLALLYMVGHGYSLQFHVFSFIVIVKGDSHIYPIIITIHGCSGERAKTCFFVPVTGWCSPFGTNEEVTFFYSLLPLLTLVQQNIVRYGNIIILRVPRIVHRLVGILSTMLSQDMSI